MHWATWVFLIFLAFFVCSLSLFISSPWWFALKSWVFLVHSNVLHTEILRFFRFTQTCLALKSWVFSGSLKCASPWNLEFFRFTQTSFYVHRKNSRFQGSAHFTFTWKKLKISVLRTFSVHLKNIKISVFCTFYVHKKTQDFSAQHQGSLIKLKFATKNARKIKKTQVAQCICFTPNVKYFAV